MKHLLKYTWAVIAFVLLSTSVFSAPLMIKCKFPTFASTSKSGAYPLNLKLDSTQFNLSFLIDHQDGKQKAFLIGNLGAVEVALLNSTGPLITFLEITETRNVTTTSIDLDTYQAVHSRHMKIGGKTFLPSQYYGKCFNQ